MAHAYTAANKIDHDACIEHQNRQLAVEAAQTGRAGDW